MSYEIIPQVGFGPIKFGMSPAEIHEILGAPTKVSAAVSPNETNEEELKHYGHRHYEWFGKSFPDPTLPQIVYDNDKVVGITVFKQSGPLILNDMDLHKKKNRQDVLENLAKHEDIYYYNDIFYFFPKSGLIITIPKNMKRFFFVELVLTASMKPLLAHKMYEPSTALD